MKFRVHIDGYAVDCQTEADALRLIRLAKQDSPARPAASSPSIRPHRFYGGGKPATKLSRALAMLREIERAGPSGVLAEHLYAAAGVESGKGLGGFMTYVNRTLEDIGVGDLHEVLRRERTKDGPRWFPGRTDHARHPNA